MVTNIILTEYWLNELHVFSDIFGLFVWLCFNATFNNVSVKLWWSVLLVEDPQKTTDLLQITDKLLSQNVVHLALIEIYYVGLFSKLCLVWLLQNIAKKKVFHKFWLKIIYFLAHLTQRVMWAILITWRPSYVVNFFKNLLLWKY